MTPEERDAFLRVPRIAKLAVLNADGSPAIMPVWFEWDGMVARLFTTRGSWKVTRITADPRVALSVEAAFGRPEAWVTIEGIASVHDRGGLELAERLLPKYYGAEQAAKTAVEWRKVPDGVLVEIKPLRIRARAED